MSDNQQVYSSRVALQPNGFTQAVSFKVPENFESGHLVAVVARNLMETDLNASNNVMAQSLSAFSRSYDATLNIRLSTVCEEVSEFRTYTERGEAVISIGGVEVGAEDVENRIHTMKNVCYPGRVIKTYRNEGDWPARGCQPDVGELRPGSEEHTSSDYYGSAQGRIRAMNDGPARSVLQLIGNVSCDQQNDMDTNLGNNRLQCSAVLTDYQNGIGCRPDANDLNLDGTKCYIVTCN